MPFPITLSVSHGSSSEPFLAGPRRREPVTVGVPFPRGVLRDCEDLLLLDPSGTAVPYQVRVVDRWGDDSVRWALFDFQATAAERAPVSASTKG